MNTVHDLPLVVFPEKLAVCRLRSDDPIPIWARPSSLLAITRTDDELSIVCDERFVPPEIKSEKGWRAIQVQGPLDFALVGVLSAIVHPLADAGISIFALSTFDTDYVLIKEIDLELAVKALESAGFLVMNYVRLSS
jgi:hypothetical protein